MEGNTQDGNPPAVGGMDGVWTVPNVVGNYASTPNINMEEKDKSNYTSIIGRFNGGQGSISTLNSSWTNPGADLSFQNNLTADEQNYSQIEVNEALAHIGNHPDNNLLPKKFNGYRPPILTDHQRKNSFHKYLGLVANGQAKPFQNGLYGGQNGGTPSGEYGNHGFQQFRFGDVGSSGNNYNQAEHFPNQQAGTLRTREGPEYYGYGSDYFHPDGTNNVPYRKYGNGGYGLSPNIKLEPENNMDGFQGLSQPSINAGHSQSMSRPSLHNRHTFHNLHKKFRSEGADILEPMSGGGLKAYEEDFGNLQNSRQGYMHESFKEVDGLNEGGSAGHEQSQGGSQDTTSADDNYYRGNAGFEPVDVYSGLILDERQYRQEVDKRIHKERGEALNSGDVVDDSPRDPREQREYIARLFNAIKCCDKDVISDKPCKNNRPAQAAQRLLGTYYPDIEVEKACWATFIACRDASLGIRMVDLHHATKHQGREAYPTFRERFDAIVKSCKVSKAACKQLLDPLYLHRLVDAPGAELQMKENNKRINAERDIQNQFGRQALKHGLEKEILEREEQLKQEILENGTGEFEGPFNTPARSRFSTPQKATSVNRAIKTRGPRTPSSRKTASTTKRSIGTISTGKRKAPAVWDVSDSEDDGDGTYHLDEERSTGAKRQFSGQSRFRVELNSSPTPSTARRQPTRTSATKARVVNRAMASELNSPVPKVELDMKYRITICELLGIPEELASQESLKVLRVYARAYNGRLANEPWIHPELPEGAYGMGPKILMKNGIVDHFSQFIEGFYNIANARGDVKGPGLAGRDPPRYFDSHGESEKDQALGIVENPLGLI